LLAMLAVSAMAILFISTPVGAGLANDSVAYIAGARSLLQGKGYSDIWLDSTLEPITHYPPLLSLSLAALGLLGIDPLRGARILNIFLYGANTGLIGLIGLRMTRSRAAGIWLAALFLLNAALLRVHVFAMSEALYLAWSLAAFLSFDLYFAARQKPLWLVLAGLASGLAVLTRYSALALLPAFGLALLLFHKTWRSRLAALNYYLDGALCLPVIWFLRNMLVAGNATNRTFEYHPITLDNILTGIYNFSQFLMPVETWRQSMTKAGLWGWILAGFGLVLLVWLVMRIWQLNIHPECEPSQSLSLTTGLYGFGYLGAVLFSMSFFDASTKFQPRILAPLYVCFLVLLVALGAWLWQKRNLAGKILVSGLVILTLAFSAYDSSLTVADFRTAGQGYASWKWHDSLIMASLRNLPPDIAIYTNTTPAVYLVTGRSSRVLPTPIDPVDNHIRGDYEQNLVQMRSDLLLGKAVLALFDTSNLEDALGVENVGSLTNGLSVVQKAQGDIIYGKP
jgi:4-amino-4-deoxy-L-arabinose transferase-like glycosyltransferase